MPNTGGFWFTPLELLEKIKEVDGVGSGLDADYLRGKTFEDRLKSAYQACSILGSVGLFETDSNADGVADGWSLSENITYGSSDVSLSEDSTEGTYSQKIYLDGVEYNNYIDLTTSDYLTLDPSFSYVFAGDFKRVYTTGSNVRIYVYIMYYDASYNQITQESWEIPATSEYETYYKELNIPVDTAYIKVQIRVQNKGTSYPTVSVYMDNLRIVGVKDIDFSNSLVQLFFPPEISSVNDLMTADHITNSYGVTKSGYEWIAYLAGHGEGVYTRYFTFKVDLSYEG